MVLTEVLSVLECVTGPLGWAGNIVSGEDISIDDDVDVAVMVASWTVTNSI